jgi:hexulose-6-phosphate isomerase
VAEVRAAVDATGIVVHGIVHGHSEEFAAPVEYCKAVGGDAVLIIAKTDRKLSHADNNKRVHTAIRAVLPLAEKHSIRLLVENVRASPHLSTAEKMAEFIDAAGSPLVGAYYDTGNTISWSKQSAQHWARVLGKRIVKIDIKDRGHKVFGDRETASKTAIGTNGGEVHWENVRKELAALDFSGWAAAEVRGGDQQRLTEMAGWMNDVLQL